MRRFCNPAFTMAGATIRHRARIGGLILFVGLALSSPSARALPPANGSNCNSTWVNNGDALNCFIQGEEEQRSGVQHPHYVGCTVAGDIFCCVDNDQGGQNCEVCAANKRPPSETLKVGAILDAQATILANQKLLSDRVDKLEKKLPGPTGKSSP